MNSWTPIEWAIFSAMQAVEAGPAHPLMTDAVVLLGQAKDKVADFIELTAPTQGWLEQAAAIEDSSKSVGVR